LAEPTVRKSADKLLRMTDGVGGRARREFQGVPAPALALSGALNSFLKPGPEPIGSVLEARSVLHSIRPGRIAEGSADGEYLCTV